MCDGDAPSASSDRWRTARKEHQCCGCGETIRRGDRYHFTSGIWDGEPASFKHCARCYAMWEALVDRADAREVVRYDLSCDDEWRDPPDDVAALAFMTPDEGQTLAVKR
jgi:hypothetical protein